MNMRPIIMRTSARSLLLGIAVLSGMICIGSLASTDGRWNSHDPRMDRRLAESRAIKVRLTKSDSKPYDDPYLITTIVSSDDSTAYNENSTKDIEIRQGGQLLMSTRAYWSNDAWESGYAGTYSYDSGNLLTESLYQAWFDYRLEDWFRASYTYEQGLPKTELWQIYSLGVWENSQRSDFSYSDDQMEMTETIQMWDYSSWTPLWKYVDTFDEWGLLTQTETYRWSGSDWVDYFTRIYERAEDGTLLSFTQSYSNASWGTNTRQRYFYYESGDIQKVLREGTNDPSSGLWFFMSQEYHSRPQSQTSFLMLLSPNGGRYIQPNSDITVDWIGLGVGNVNLSMKSMQAANWTLIGQSVSKTNASGGSFTYSMPAGEIQDVVFKVEDAANPAAFDVSDQSMDVLISHEYLTHETRNLKISVFSTGYLGSNSVYGDGITYHNNANAAYCGSFLLGINHDIVGHPYHEPRPIQNVELMKDFTSNATFDQISSTAFRTETGYSIVDSIRVHQTAYSDSTLDVLFLRYQLQNYSDQNIENITTGLFMDWDIGNLQNNLGGYDEALALVYQYSPSGPDSAYYALMGLPAMSGARVTVSNNETMQDTLYTWLTTFKSEEITEPEDYRTYLGSEISSIGPYDSKDVWFAVLAGSTLEELKENAQKAIDKWTAFTSTVREAVSAASSYELSQNYPNPFNPATWVRFRLSRPGTISLKLFNLRGQDVRTVVERHFPAGEHRIRIDASGLPSGIYAYRLESPEGRLCRKCLLIR